MSAKHTWTEPTEWTITSDMGAAYIKRSEPTDGLSVRQVEMEAIADYNADGQLIGVELTGQVSA